MGPPGPMNIGGGGDLAGAPFAMCGEGALGAPRPMGGDGALPGGPCAMCGDGALGAAGEVAVDGDGALPYPYGAAWVGGRAAFAAALSSATAARAHCPCHIMPMAGPARNGLIALGDSAGLPVRTEAIGHVTRRTCPRTAGATGTSGTGRRPLGHEGVTHAGPGAVPGLGVLCAAQSEACVRPGASHEAGHSMARGEPVRGAPHTTVARREPPSEPAPCWPECGVPDAPLDARASAARDPKLVANEGPWDAKLDAGGSAAEACAEGGAEAQLPATGKETVRAEGGPADGETMRATSSAAGGGAAGVGAGFIEKVGAVRPSGHGPPAGGVAAGAGVWGGHGVGLSGGGAARLGASRTGPGEVERLGPRAPASWAPAGRHSGLGDGGPWCCGVPAGSSQPSQRWSGGPGSPRGSPGKSRREPRAGSARLAAHGGFEPLGRRARSCAQSSTGPGHQRSCSCCGCVWPSHAFGAASSGRGGSHRPPPSRGGPAGASPWRSRSCKRDMAMAATPPRCPAASSGPSSSIPMSAAMRYSSGVHCRPT